jgi:hypothetical protein
LSAEWLLRAAGLLQIALALLHAFFPKRFDWAVELARLSLLNRQIFVVHTVFIGFALLLMGSLSAFAPQALLVPTLLSRLVLAGIASFWALRLLVQWLYYDSALWRGHRFNTLMHVLFTGLWAYLAGVYGWLFYVQSAAAR